MTSMPYGKYAGCDLIAVPRWALEHARRFHNLKLSDEDRDAIMSELRRREFSMQQQRRRDTALMRRRKGR